MTIHSRRWASLAGGSLLVIGLSAACGPVSLPFVQSGGDSNGVGVAQPAQPVSVPVRSAANATPTPATGRTTSGPRPVPVKRDSLTETLSVDGMVAATTQEQVKYRWRAIVEDVKVKSGQAVKQGDILIDFSAGDTNTVLQAARTRLQSSQDNLAAAQADARSKQAAAAQKAAADQKQQQQAVLNAQIALQRAQENLATVKAGKSESERQVAQTSVTYYGTTQVQQAQDALDKLLAGPSPETIQAAQRDVANSRLALTKVQADLDALTRGPDPAALRAADAVVQRTQKQLQIAQASKVDPKAPDAALASLKQEAAIQDAQTALQNAQDGVTRLKQPPADIDVQSAKNAVLDANVGLSTAQAKLTALQDGPDQAAVDDATVHLEHVKHAQAELQASLDELNSHPTPSELHQAEDQVRGAQTALDSARAAAAGVPDLGGPDLSALEKAVSQNQAAVAAAEQSLEDTHLRAPFDGTVLSVRTKPGETPAPSTPVIILAKPQVPIVRVDLDDTQAARLVVGQQASVQIGAGTPAAVRTDATVSDVTPASQDGSVGASAILQPSWADGQLPKFGTPAQVTVNLAQKQGVLVVPKSAIHQSAGKARVEVQDGTLRRLVTVEVGITTADTAEIVSGLTEGQIVLAGPA
jgi:multidrug efflux pump subunit AcrA (membrane-fusion protein)